MEYDTSLSTSEVMGENEPVKREPSSDSEKKREEGSVEGSGGKRDVSKYNVVVVGMRGVGKSTLSRNAANILHMRCVDIDSQVCPSLDLSLSTYLSAYRSSCLLSGYLTSSIRLSLYLSISPYLYLDNI